MTECDSCDLYVTSFYFNRFCFTIDNMSGTETELLTAFRTIYFQLVENVQEAITGHA